MAHQWDASELPVSWGPKHVSLFFCAGDFRKSPLPSFERSIICIIWHFFHIEMELFSEANPFPSLRFTLICGCWPEINSHFSCTFCWKSLLQRIWTFFFFFGVCYCTVWWSLSQNRCVYKSMQVIFLYGLNTGLVETLYVRRCLGVTFRVENEQGPSFPYYCWKWYCFLAF